MIQAALCGPAGGGKSSVSQTFVELIQASGRSYGGRFFCSRGEIEHDQAPPIHNHLPPINIQTQMLIIEPKLNGLLHSAAVIIIDDPDESHEHDAQQLILTDMPEAHKFRTSLQFLVSSRPEAHISETFYSDQLYTTTRII